MEIKENAVVGMHYHLTDDGGQVLDTSKGKEPLYFISGLGHIIPGLDKELQGKKTGDKFNAVIEPDMAYGERDDNMIQKIPKTQFEAPGEIEVGMQFEVQTEVGALLVNVSAVEGDEITVDGNHPLAGVRLTFDIEVTEVRDATKEELEHGHVHGPGGHEH